MTRTEADNILLKENDYIKNRTAVAGKYIYFFKRKNNNINKKSKKKKNKKIYVKSDDPADTKIMNMIRTKNTRKDMVVYDR